MSDIVERLRELEAVESELACECGCPPEATANYRYAMTCAEAADEIERLRAALSTARADALEEAARVAQESVVQECCGNFDGDYGSLLECCGQPNVTPMYPEEIAAAIRALKSGGATPSQSDG